MSCGRSSSATEGGRITTGQGVRNTSPLTSSIARSSAQTRAHPPSRIPNRSVSFNVSMSSPSTRGATIRIFLIDGTPQGRRLVDRIGWTGACLAFSRADYGSARERSELLNTCVYVLTGPDPDGKRPQKIYIGEGDVARTRMDAHHKEKDFWTHGYVLTSKDGSLNKNQEAAAS